ncbi:hypothetical protein OB13_20680, partial [Pontibacter sp. HJ8]
YKLLKEHWTSKEASNIISPHGIESWKATFEEFGLLYVLSRTDEIIITDGGQKLKDAGENGKQLDFAKAGVSLLLRYPLTGPPRRKRGKAQDESDILPYWFLYASMLELGGYLYRSEIDLILSRVFNIAQIPTTIELIRKLRSGEENLNSIRETNTISTPAFYNTMNMIVVHASMNYLLWKKEDVIYSGVKDIKYTFPKDMQALVTDSMGGVIGNPECEEDSSFLERMPSAPAFVDEKEYFKFLAAPLSLEPKFSESSTSTPFKFGEYLILKEGIHYTYIDGLTIKGTINTLCRVAVQQRVILNHNVSYTYIVLGKRRSSDGQIIVDLRSARPITNKEALKPYLEDSNG